MSLFRLTCSSLVPRAILRTQIRNVTEEAPRLRRGELIARQRLQGKQPTFKERLMAPAGETGLWLGYSQLPLCLHLPFVIAFSIGQAALAGGAAVGIGALCFYGLGLSKEAGLIDRAM